MASDSSLWLVVVEAPCWRSKMLCSSSADVTSSETVKTTEIPSESATECQFLAKDNVVCVIVRSEAGYSDAGTGPRPHSCDDPSLGLRHPRPAQLTWLVIGHGDRYIRLHAFDALEHAHYNCKDSSRGNS